MSYEGLKQKVDHLLGQNAQHCDPVRFAYIQSLVKRIEQPMYCENASLITKATVAIEQYELALAARRAQVTSMLDAFLRISPDKSQEAHALFEQCQFNQLEKLCKQLHRTQKANIDSAPLSELNKSINKFVDDTPADDEELSFEQILNLQEKDVVATASARQSLKHESLESHDKENVEITEPQENREAVIELQSMKVFRESVKHVNIDKIIDRAINDEPANPGPHNPHMLAIKSLTQMRELSPEYLRRFASYIETLLWLEKNATKLGDFKKVL